MEQMKEALTQPPILSISKRERRISIDIDAYNKQVRCVF